MTMFLRPNPSSGVPVYRQLMDQVRDALGTGALRPGDPLPGIRPLAEQLVINPNVVARAYRELEQDRTISVRDGVATGLAAGARFETSSRTAFHYKSSGELAAENSRLEAMIAVEVARRVEGNRELDRAREVQERLFPQSCPPVAGLDYAGTCRPAGRVGGDYYDFIPIGETGLGIAIGDVSGKGISAALLMATLRTYLHVHTRRRVGDLAEMMASLNRHVYESSSANRYATFFYGQYESSTRVLEYVNAGHNPPVILRASGDGHTVLRLDVGGPAVGLLPACSYVAQRVTLEEGDVLVLFTDGICEAMNAAGDEWGEECLTQVVRANRSLAAGQLVDRVMAGSDGFVGGAPQYDDMTLITARVIARESSTGAS
jgi:sigma-B regulation protein RsbU (phosphoserine phosphatase)